MPQSRAIISGPCYNSVTAPQLHHYSTVTSMRRNRDGSSNTVVAARHTISGRATVRQRAPEKPFIARTSGSFGSSNVPRDMHAGRPGERSATIHFPLFFSTCPSARPLFSQRAKCTHRRAVRTIAVVFKPRSRNCEHAGSGMLHNPPFTNSSHARAQRGPRVTSPLTLSWSRLRAPEVVDLNFYRLRDGREVHLLYAKILSKIT